jgi:hypothetical protein
LHRSIERPQRYRLLASWKTTPSISAAPKTRGPWRALVGSYFASPPEAEHTETVLTSAL